MFELDLIQIKRYKKVLYMDKQFLVKRYCIWINMNNINS